MKASGPKSNEIVNKSRAYQRFLFVALCGISKGKCRHPKKFESGQRMTIDTDPNSDF